MVSLHICLDIITSCNGVSIVRGLGRNMAALGEGAYGKVTVIQTGDKKYALKETILPEFPEELEAAIASVREQDMNLIHSHIIERHWCRFFDNKFQVCMELGKPVYKADERRILHDICQALYFMHSKGFIHRDVKPQNIVQVGKVYKLIDFGLTRKGTCNTALTGYMISRWFRPPELLEAKEDLHYDGRVDMYSLALTAYFLHNQKPLFSGETPVLLKMYKRYKPRGLYKHLICDYKDRFTSKELLKHCSVAPIEGSEGELPHRTGHIAKFAFMLRGGYDVNAKKIGYKGIYNEL